MNQTEKALYCLLMVALTEDASVSMPSGVDWNELYALVRTQGIASIAMQGLQTLMDIRDYKPSGVDVKTKLKWYGLAKTIENTHEKQLQSAKDLAKIWHEKGIRILVLKGFAFADYYPIPSQRPASDMDCYLCGKYEEGNGVIEKLGIKVAREDYRHSTFQYKDVFIENHKICTTVRGGKQRRLFERYLRSLLENEPTRLLKDSCLEIPCDRFNALYFLQHSHRHFLREGITLRYICDWAMILKNANCFDPDFWKTCEKNDLQSFAESLTRLAYIVCGVKASWIRGDVKLYIQDSMLLWDCYHIADNAIKYGNNLKAHIQIVKNMLRMRWKYRYFSKRSMEKELISSVWAYLREDEKEVD